MSIGKLIKYLKILGLFALITLLAYFMLFSFLNPIKTIYNISAQTEKIEIKVSERNTSRYNILGATVIDYEAEELLKEFDGSLELNKGVTLAFERISSGPAVMTIFSNTEESVGNFYKGTGGELILQAPAFINVFLPSIDSLLTQGISMVFPISGEVNLGRSVDVEIFGESTALLKGGTITMTGYSRLSRSFFEAGSRTLELGDYLIFEDINENAFGFLTINEDPGLQVAYRVEAKRAKVIKPGPRDKNSGYPISASWYNLFVADRFFQSLSLFVAVLLIIITVSTFTMDAILFRKEIKK